MVSARRTTVASPELRQALQSLEPFFWRAGYLSFFAGLLVLVPTVYMLEVYDRVINSRNHMTLAMLTLLVLAGFVVLEVLEWSRKQILQDAGRVLDECLSQRVFDASFEARLKGANGGGGATAGAQNSSPDSARASAYANGVQPMTDFARVRDFLHSPLALALLGAPVVLIFAALLFAMSPVLGWAAVAGALVQALLTWLTERRTHAPLTGANAAAGLAQRVAEETLRNAEVIRAMGMLGRFRERWQTTQNELLRLQAQASDASGGLQALARLVQQLMSSVLLGLAAWLLLRDSLAGGAGMLIVGSVLGGRMLGPMVLMVSQWRSLVNARDAWGRLDQLLTRLPARPAGMPLPAPTGRLVVDGAMVGAPVRLGASQGEKSEPGRTEPILWGLKFALKPGEVVAVVGPSAAGKSTLARMLVGLWPPMRGQVSLDGADISSWSKAELGPHVGYLPQGVELFDGTVAENIARFGNTDDVAVEAAARAAGLHEFILALPDGYATSVGPDGMRLSGGQRQRVALARALYGSPVFVVLDEPNASLDDAGDAALAAAITQFKARGTTFVVMTHRGSLLKVADKLLLLQAGTQQAFGPKEEVIAAARAKAADTAAGRPANEPHVAAAGNPAGAPGLAAQARAA